MLLSFTIPCYCSEKTVGDVVREIAEIVGQREEYDYEIIAVNDASGDNTWRTLKALSEENPKLRIVDLARNGGKHAALMAAYSLVRGEVVIGVDDDGQCPIDRLWDLLEPLWEGADVSMAKYPHKQQSGFKNWGSHLNDVMVRILIGKPKGLTFSNFIARKRFVCDEMIHYRNPYPYLEGLTLRATQNIAQVPMEERVRQSGQSGYNFKKSLMLWINGCTAFSVKPLRLATALGMLFSLLGFCMGLFLIIRRLMVPGIQAGYTSIMAMLVFIGGVLMLLLGMIGEYLGRIYICINNSPQYVIREKYNFDEDSGRIDECGMQKGF